MPKTNGNTGITFEIANTAGRPVRIESLDQGFDSNGTADMEVWTLAGSCEGKETIQSALTIVGTATTVHGQTPSLTRLPIDINITIQPGDVQSFYITSVSGIGDVGYLTGNGQYGNVYASNIDIQLIAGAGVIGKFQSASGTVASDGGNGRLWIGAVNYCTL